MNQNVAGLFICLVFVTQKFNTVTILNTVAQIVVRGKEVFMYSGILFSKVISTFIKTLKGDLPVFSGITRPSGIS
jgi:hypothetical protein